MSMMLELSSRMIDYLPEEVAKIQRTVELALSESRTEEEMFSIVDNHLTTKHLREGAREFWDVFSNAADYAEPLTEGVGGFPVDRANILKNRAKDRNIGRVMDVNGQQVLVINKRTNGDYVVVDKMGKRSVKKGEGLGTTRTETIELNLLDTIEEEDLSASESPNGSKKKSGKTTVIINPKASDLMKEGKKEEKKGKKALRWQDSDGDGKWYEPGEDVKVKKEEVELEEKIDVGADAGATIKDFVKSKDPRFAGDTKKQRIKRALGAYYGAQKEEVEYVEEDKDPCWKGYQMVGMKKKGGRDVPNCVPKEEYEDLVGELVSEGYDDEAVREILEAIEDGMEVVFEENGYSIISEETLDEEFYQDVELVANWLQEEEIIESEDDFFELMDELTEEEIDELYTIVMEAEGSYGATPKAYSAARQTKMTAKRKPFLKKMLSRTNPANRTSPYSSPRKGMTSDDRERARAGSAHGVGTRQDHDYPSEGPGGVTKNPKKLRKQKAMGEIAKEEFEIDEATAMAKRGYDETKLRQRAGGGEAADRATSLENRPTYGDANKAKQRQNYARAQRGDFRKTASSNPGLHGYAHKSDDPKVKAKQAARGAQRGALTPNERKSLNMGYEMIGDSLEEGGMEVRTYSWREVMGEAWKKGGKKNGSC